MGLSQQTVQVFGTGGQEQSDSSAASNILNRFSTATQNNAMRGNQEAARRFAAYGNVEAQNKGKRDKIFEAFAIADKPIDDNVNALLSEHSALSRIHQALLLGGPQAEQALRAAGYDGKMSAAAIQAELDRTERDINKKAGDTIYAAQRADTKMREMRMNEMKATVEDNEFNREKKNREEANAAILSNMSHDDIMRLNTGKMAIPDGMTQRDVLAYMSSSEGRNRVDRAQIVAGAINPQLYPGMSGANQTMNTAAAMTDLSLASMPLKNLQRSIEENKRDYAAQWAESARQAAVGGVQPSEPPQISEYKINGQYFPAALVDKHVTNRDSEESSLIAMRHLDETNVMHINNQMRKSTDAFARITAGDSALQQSFAGDFLIVQERYARLMKLKPSESGKLVSQFAEDTDRIINEAIGRKTAGMNLPPDQMAYLHDYMRSGYMNPKDRRHQQLVATAGVQGLVTSGEPLLREFGLYLNGATERQQGEELNTWKAGVEYKRDPNQNEVATIIDKAQQKTHAKAQVRYTRGLQQGIFDEFIDIARVGYNEGIDKRTGKPLDPDGQDRMTRLHLYMREVKDPKSDIGKGIYREVTSDDGKKKLELDEDMLITKLAVLDAALQKKGVAPHLANDYMSVREDFKYLHKRFPLPQDPASQLLMGSILNAGAPEWAAVSPDTAQLRLLESNAKTAKNDLLAAQERAKLKIADILGYADPSGLGMGISTQMSPLDEEVRRLATGPVTRGSLNESSTTKRIETNIQLRRNNAAQGVAITTPGKPKPVNSFEAERARISAIVKNGMPASSD